ncbi:tripartite tricarboxylate transporter permease [Pelagibacterium lacus]|uniref:Tripartite tricarboxylate transporter permease n=1 Tax=Pelagibacterium lacus TaxID=2282655 RepID=A0A369VZN3_9HYPH|nr:tripartite tricarboxylate transporter permease [Pelagibacterium lacus]RDE07856.1 tripartite tricarboxylate transporter permease [Pelagibacterium lacus]
MEFFDHLALGAEVALQPHNLFFCLIGALVGTLIGVLPGIGPVATLSILLPLTFHLEPTSALIMLAGIYYGAQYGGSTTAILVNLPGEASSVITCIDGYEMAKQGRAGAALAIAALGSLFAGIVATILLMLFAPPLASIALQFGPAEYFSLMLLGLATAIVLSQGSLLRAFAMVLMGLLLGTIGTDATTGAQRLTFGMIELSDGIDFVPVAVGLFAIPEIIRNLEFPEARSVVNTKITSILPTREDLARSWKAVLRGTGIGSLLGILPGSGALISSFAAYVAEKRFSKTPDRFGKGAIEGVAAPEAANNASAQMSFVPLLTLGIPGSATLAVMAGAMTMQGIRPGPEVMTTRPDLFWGLIVSMFVGNLMLVIINLPLIGIWVSMLKVPYRLLYLVILVMCCVGVFTVNSSPFDLVLLCIFSLLGIGLRKWKFEMAPLILAFILGPLIEEHLRRAMLISNGDPSVFVTRPISLVFLVLIVALIGAVALPQIRKRRDEAVAE